MFRYIRMTGVLVLMLVITIAPVAPVYAQQQTQTGQMATGQQQNSQSQAAPPANQNPTGTQLGPPPPPPGPKKESDQGQSEYVNGKRAFPNILAPYTQLHVPMPNLTNTSRLQDLIKDGKLVISLQDAIALALENNMDIAVARYTPWLAEAAWLKQKPFSAVGNVQSFDPLYQLITGVTTSNSPVANPFLTGAGAGVQALSSHQFIANSTYLEGFPTGTNLIVTQSNTRSASNGANTFNPSVTSTLNVTVQQNLLRGLGIVPNKRNILVAKNTKLSSDYAFKQQILTTVTTVSQNYWELVFARQFVGVEQKVLEAANRLLSDDQKQVQIGTLAPLDVTSAEANVASANQGLIQAQTAVLQDQVILLAAITKNPLSPELANIEIVPTDNTYLPPVTENLPLADAVKEALTNRPDYQESLINLKSDDINIQATKNELLPSLLLQGNYGWTGLGGQRIIAGGVVPNTFVADLNEPIVSSTGTPIGGFVPVAVTLPATVNNTGVGTAFSQIFHGQFPNYGAQINFQLPIRNRSAQADSISALLTQRLDLTKLQQQQNVIAVDVSNTQITLQQARATLSAAQATVRFQQQALDATTKELQYGTATPLAVVQQQQTLATFESQEVRAEINLVEAKVQFDRAMGRTFSVNNIEVQSAKRTPGDNLIPGTSSTGELLTAPLSNADATVAAPLDVNATAPKRDPKVQQQQ